MSFFWVPADADGLSITPNPMMILEFGGNCQTYYYNVRVPETHLIGEVNKGFSIIEGIILKKSWFLSHFQNNNTT
jgi:alkylation response protein AidB-like acyl-CoA dehydrogenase